MKIPGRQKSNYEKKRVIKSFLENHLSPEYPHFALLIHDGNHSQN